MNIFDTIAAVSTPPGVGGVAVIRVSGPEAVAVSDCVFKSVKGKLPSELPERFVSFGDLTGKDGSLIDQVLLTVFKAPRSFTGEDVVEISCHGGKAVTELILKELVLSGARIAGRGEFTKRAFLNGKLDLTQAEAIMDIISAEDEFSLKSGENHLQGRLKEKTEKIREKILDIISQVLAVIDYPDEEIGDMETSEITEILTSAQSEINGLINTYNTGKIIRDGANIVIAGKPNAGKSSLMNAFLKEERAIVTDIAGTTRDVLEENLNLGGLKVRVTDTAGIRESDDPVESIGIRRAVECVKKADLVLYVADKTTGIDEGDIELINAIRDKKTVGIINKSDLEGADIKEKLKELTGCIEVFEISAINGGGVDALSEYIKNAILCGEVDVSENLFITNKRHYEELLAAESSIKRAMESLNCGLFADIVTIDLENAVSALGNITGETVNEAVVSNIFEKFCVGK